MMQIGKYEVLEEIGRGAMGVVYKAFDPLIGREVAIKVISENALALPEIKERFYREARSVGKLNHENITIVHDVGEVDGKPYLVMEYLAGTDLKLIIREKTPLRLLQKLEYARQICEGLQYAHTHHVTHRDIKPENIKILPGGNIKIMDFGIARPAGSDLTAPGMMLGTPWYMSPEQIKGQIVDARTDIFSFGVVLFELLMYKKPFEGNVSTVIYSIMHDEPAALSLESNLVADLQNLLAKCLAKNAEERYRDCAVLLKVLDTIIAKARQQEQKIIGLLMQAKALIAQQKFFEALAPLEEILLIDLTFAEAQSLRQQCLEKIKTTAATPRMSKNMAGTIISHYKIIARLGVGGMGVVYKAEDTRLKRLVALKFLSPHLTADAIAKERFIREAQAASALDHPNICTIYEIDETAASPDLQFTEGLGQLFICMAYYAGETLKETMIEGGLPLGQIMNIAVQIAQGLAKAHENGIVHRDIKPANIMITKDGLVKILDFGLAKLTGETRLTRSGVTAGTLSYLSPEQAQNQEVDHRSDIWSLGVLLYQMTTGKLPFDGEYDLAILYSIVNKDPTPASQLNSNIPAELEQVISRALQKPPHDRYASMQKMLDDLKRAERRVDKMKEHETTPLLEEVGSLITKGKLFLGKNEYPEALSRFRAVLAIDAKNREVEELIATCERKQREAQQISKWLDMAKKQFEKGAYEDSLNTVQTILALDPNHIEAQDWAKKNQQCPWNNRKRLKSCFPMRNFI
jgi:serine/threonine protein kinase